MGFKKALEYQSSLINKLNGVNSSFAQIQSIANKVNCNFNALSSAAAKVAGIQSLGSTLAQINTKFLPITPNVFKNIGASSQIVKLASQQIQIPDLSKYVFPDYSKILENYKSFGLTEKYVSVLDKGIEIFSNYNYPLPLDLGVNELRKFLKKLNKEQSLEQKNKLVDEFIIMTMSKDNWAYMENVIAKLKENSKIQNERIQILSDCLKVIRRFGKKTSANVVLPALIAQLDGCWLDIIGGDDNIKRQRLRKIINDDYSKSVSEILTDILFEQKTHKGAKNHNFCRNKILHGEALEYGTIQNVIRIFLMFEFLNTVKEISEPQVA